MHFCDKRRKGGRDVVVKVEKETGKWGAIKARGGEATRTKVYRGTGGKTNGSGPEAGP